MVFRFGGCSTVVHQCLSWSVAIFQLTALQVDTYEGMGIDAFDGEAQIFDSETGVLLGVYIRLGFA